MTIIALDPGKVTGWASWTKSFWAVGQVEPDGVWPTLLEDFRDIETLIVERFIHRPKFHVDLTPVEIIGIIKQFSWQYGIPIVWQTPSQAKHYFTNEKLKEMGLYTPGKTHGNDAMRHIQYYLEFGEGRNIA